MVRLHDLNAMEIDVWVRRDRRALESAASARLETAQQGEDLAAKLEQTPAQPARTQVVTTQDEIGVLETGAIASPSVLVAVAPQDSPTVAEHPSSPPRQSARAPAEQAPAQPPPDRLEHKSLAALRQSVAVCERCELHRSRTQTVFGVGDSNAQLLVIGEAPGAEEDRRGEPFVGPAGQLLNAMLQAIGIRREAAYIANILKCHPPANRDPHQEEVAQCAQYLSAQVQLIAPRVILAVGRIAAQNLLDNTTPIGKMRGRRYTYRDTGIPVIVTYHPAYLLREPQEKRKAWQDLKLVRSLLEEPLG